MENSNYLVIMAGGIGSRFWPFSRSSKPKQFLDFFGTGKTLIQMTVDRFRPIVPMENVLIVTNVLYKDLVLQQIPELQPSQILCEPARRNTAPCIAYAISHIKAMQYRRAVENGVIKNGEAIDIDNPIYNANLIVAPSDHLIMQETVFQDIIRESIAFVSKNDMILTLGMKPTRPESGYGYIQYVDEPVQLEEAHGVKQVKRFTEKPNLDLAKSFLQSGDFLWNSGMFVWNLKTICTAFRNYLPEVVEIFQGGEKLMGTPEEKEFVQKNFPACPNISIDYGVLEKAENVYVKPADFGWSDLGTWGSLYDLSEKDENKNVTIHCESAFYDSEGNIVTLEPGKLVVLQGMKDMIVAEQNGVLLICEKEKEQQIRQFVNDASEKYNDKFN